MAETAAEGEQIIKSIEKVESKKRKASTSPSPKKSPAKKAASPKKSPAKKAASPKKKAGASSSKKKTIAKTKSMTDVVAEGAKFVSRSPKGKGKKSAPKRQTQTAKNARR